MAEKPPTALTAAAAAHSDHGEGHHPKSSFWALTLGSVGVVYGDIGTSPLYAMRESLAHAGDDGVTRNEVLGIVSLLLWALILIVTVKYVFFLLRADNKGEGGTLSLMALARRAIGKFSPAVFLIGIAGAALFYGDAMLTPAISVLSAVEGLKLVTPIFNDYIIAITLVILFGLFSMQSRGTGKVAALFGPVMTLWFLTLAALGIFHLSDDWGIIGAFNPLHGIRFLAEHGQVGFIVMGSVFLAVTGAEGIYADMGHFGRKPIQTAWLYLVFPSLALNYLGQGAMVLHNPETLTNPFFMLAPSWGLLPLVLLATVATVIACQAVITGAYSMTQQAISLGFLPRMEIRHTSEKEQGQIYLPQITSILFIGVVALVLSFRSSSDLASAYGVAVSGTMIVNTLLFFVIVWKVWNLKPWLAALAVAPFLIIDTAFFSANMFKIWEGGYVPLLIAVAIMIMMWTWVRGSRILIEKTHRESVTMEDLITMLEASKPTRVAGTAIFLTNEPDIAPTALMHNLKHNKVLHAKNIIMTVRIKPMPRVPFDQRVEIKKLSDDMTQVGLTFGYMETPNVPHALGQYRKRQGLKFDIMSTSFFLGRRTIKAAKSSGMPLWQDKLYIMLARNATNATDFFHIPSGRVVELGTQITV